MTEQTQLQESTPSKGNDGAGAPPAWVPPDNPLARLSELLAAEKAEGGEAEKAEGGEAPKPNGKPKDLAALAAVLKLDAAELYKIEVPSARDGAEPYTLGKLKDLAAEHDDFTFRSLQIEDDNRKRQAEFARAEQELQAIMATLPPDAIKPEARAALQAKRDKALTNERQRVLDAIPEWKNADVRTQELEQMVEHLKDYGFPETYIANVFDHRTLRYIRENWRREKQIRAALEKVAERKPNTPPKSKASGTEKPKRGNGAQGYQPPQVGHFTNAINKASSRG